MNATARFHPRRLAPLCVALLCAGCGPTGAQAGAAVLIAAPFVLVLLYAIQAPLILLWRTVRKDLVVDGRPAVAAFITLLLLAWPAVYVDRAGHYASLAVIVWGVNALICGSSSSSGSVSPWATRGRRPGRRSSPSHRASCSAHSWRSST